MARMTGLNRGLAIISIALVLSGAALAQAGSGNILFGDFKVEGDRPDTTRPQIFLIILYSTSGQVVGRQQITSDGRYRFDNVRNGEYDLVVELQGSEVSRMRFLVNEIRRTDIRRDITLAWRENLNAGTKNTGTVAAGDSYTRTPANKTRFEKALEAAKKKDFDQAASLLQQLVDDDPKDWVAWTELGTLHFRLDKIADAEKFYLRALDANPTFLLALLNLGKLRISQKNFDAAIETLGRAAQSEPRSADANYLLGDAYLQVKKGSKAVVYFNEALKLDPIGKADAHLRLGALYNAAGLKDKAALEYEQFLNKKADYPDKKRLEQYILENKKR
ncbi:MAG TPA: tetratricopeptide repeat protein [Blastocatellia bacterium]|nr:tetratricopeptide repeat protein [Blastocatellia bacterium]